MTKKAQTKAKILSAAWQLFTEKGYEQTSTRDIASQAQVATGTVFSHFANKLDLLKAGLEEKLGELIEHASQSDKSETPTERLLHYAQALYPFYLSQREFSKALFKQLLWQSHSLDPQLVAFKRHLTGEKADQQQYADLLMDLYFMTLLESLNDESINSEMSLSRLKTKLSFINRQGN